MGDSGETADKGKGKTKRPSYKIRTMRSDFSKKFNKEKIQNAIKSGNLATIKEEISNFRNEHKIPTGQSIGNFLQYKHKTKLSDLANSVDSVHEAGEPKDDTPLMQDKEGDTKELQETELVKQVKEEDKKKRGVRPEWETKEGVGRVEVTGRGKQVKIKTPPKTVTEKKVIKPKTDTEESSGDISDTMGGTYFAESDKDARHHGAASDKKKSPKPNIKIGKAEYPMFTHPKKEEEPVKVKPKTDTAPAPEGFSSSYFDSTTEDEKTKSELEKENKGLKEGSWSDRGEGSSYLKKNAKGEVETVHVPKKEDGTYHDPETHTEGDTSPQDEASQGFSSSYFDTPDTEETARQESKEFRSEPLGFGGGETPETPHVAQIPNSRITTRGKSKEQLIKDIKWFISKYGEELSDIIPKFTKNLDRKSLVELRRLHKRIIGLLGAKIEPDYKGQKVGVVLDAEEYIESKMKQIMLENRMDSLRPSDIVVDLEKQGQQPDPNVRDIGSYELKMNPDGQAMAQKEPIYRAIPFSQEEEEYQPEDIDAKEEVKKKKKTFRLELPKPKMRNLAVTGEKLFNENPFLRRQSKIRLKTIL